MKIEIIKKVHANPILPIKIGNNCETRVLLAQLLIVAMDAADDLKSIGKISLPITQGIEPIPGANDMRYVAKKTMKRIDDVREGGSCDAKPTMQKATVEMRHPTSETSSNGRRPAFSTYHVPTSVKMALMKANGAEK